MQPRDYQSYGVNQLWEWFRNNPKPGTHPVILMPTGTGKSIIIAVAIQQAFKWQPNARVMMLTTSQDLIEQNYEKLLKVWPTAPVGLYSAGLNKRESFYPITFAGIQSVADKAHLFDKIDLLFIDECDRVPDDMRSQYRKFLAALEKRNPNMRSIGLTATDWRTAAGRITESDNAWFTDVAVDMTTLEAFNWFVSEGYLSPLTSKKTKLVLKTDGVQIVAGEYNGAQLERAVNKTDITEAAIREALEVAHGRRKWLVFCAGVKHVIDTTEILNYMGVEARAVHSKSPKQRKPNIDWFRSYKGDGPIALVNNDVLTVGFDDPSIDLIVILRPTASSRLWVQILGRGTRPFYAEGFDLSTTWGRLQAIAASVKTDCMVLDYARNVNRLGPINDPVKPQKKGKGGPQPAPIKVCPQCEEQVHISVRKCPGKLPISGTLCNYEFPENIKIVTEASAQQVQKAIEPPVVEIFAVDSVNYVIHNKAGTSPMLKVRYYCGMRSFDDYVCIEHPPGSFAQRKAVKWWRDRAVDGSVPTPSDAASALAWAERLKTPTHLSVWTNKKYPEITDYCFDGSAFNRNPVTDPAHLVKPKVYVSRGKTSLQKQQSEEDYVDQY